jgi:MFS family permease
MAFNAIYATSVIGLSPGQFGIGVGVSAGVALALSTPTGHLADRIGPRAVQIWSFVALGPLTAALLIVNGFDQYILAMSLQAVAYSASRSARMAMVAGLIPPEERVRTRAFLRATSNVSVSVGAGIAGVVLAVGTTSSYRWALAFNAVTFTVAGLLTVLLPSVPPQSARPGPRLEVMRDRPYLTFVVLDGLLSMHYLLLDVVLPLWVMHHTRAPRWMIAVILLVNTVSVVLLQVRAARGMDEPKAAGSWGISFGLAPDHAQGQYQGTYAMGADLAKIIAPVVLTWLAIQHGIAGWLIIAVGFAVVGSFVPVVVAWANRRRPAQVPAQA